MKKTALLSILLLVNLLSFSQKYTISGYITDEKNGERLIGANIYNANTYSGTVSNAYGFYSVTLSDKEILLTVSYVGYATFQRIIALTSDIVLNIELSPSIEIKEVLVEGTSNIASVESSQMSAIEIPMKTIKNLPTLLGEPDIIKCIQLLPGVQSGSEGTSGMYVRGGGPDQNLILLDGAPVYNASHLFGFFSVFNSDAIQNVTLIKGGFPARYGGRLSSVLDISMKEGNSKEFKGVASIGLISSKLALEGPLGKKTSFIISGRRTYIDVLTYPFQAMQESILDLDKFRVGYYFYDVNAKINHTINDKNRIYLSAYLGKDRFYAKMEDTYDNSYTNPETNEIITSSEKSKENLEFWWGNFTTTLRWNHTLSKKLFANTSATYSRYKMLTGENGSYNGNQSEKMEYTSGINDYSTKVDFDYFLNTNHTIKAGASYIYHTFNPGVLAEGYNTDSVYVNVENGNSTVYAHELASYFEDDIRIGSLIKLNVGVHWSGFSVKNNFYSAFEPRVSTRILLTKNWSAKAAYANMNQYINLLANSNIGLPFDLWVPSTDLIKPQKSNQYSIGSVYSFKYNFDFSVEGFYKEMTNLVEYREGATFYSLENDWEQKITQGKGWSYGIELLLMKKVGKTTGWIGYTWSKSERQFNQPDNMISSGKVFPYKYDRRHDLSIVLTYKLKDNIDIGATWVFGTGNATTLGLEKYPSTNPLVYHQEGYTGINTEPDITYYETRNNYRMPSYHRLDIGINFHKQKKWGVRTWNISVYNVYNRKNAFMLNWEYNYDKKEQELIKYSLFPIIPSFSYRIEF